MKCVRTPWVCVVLEWRGFRGCLARYRWGIVGRRWPTLYLGPIRVVTGP